MPESFDQRYSIFSRLGGLCQPARKYHPRDHGARKRSQDAQIWTPGCATGEEAYSIAILFQEIADRRGERWDIKLFAMRWPPFSGHNPVCVSYDGVGEK